MRHVGTRTHTHTYTTTVGTFILAYRISLSRTSIISRHPSSETVNRCESSYVMHMRVTARAWQRYSWYSCDNGNFHDCTVPFSAPVKSMRPEWDSTTCVSSCPPASCSLAMLLSEISLIFLSVPTANELLPSGVHTTEV